MLQLVHPKETIFESRCIVFMFKSANLVISMHHVIGDCKGPIQVSDCFENLFLINVVFDG